MLVQLSRYMELSSFLSLVFHYATSVHAQIMTFVELFLGYYIVISVICSLTAIKQFIIST